MNRRIPLGRHATPEELAGLFAYLAGDEAAYFTGSVIVMDGGETAGSVISGPGGPGRMTSPPAWRTKTEPESRRPVVAGAGVVIAGQALVARSLGVHPFWLFSLASAVLLLASLAVYEGRNEPAGSSASSPSSRWPSSWRAP